LKNNLVIILCIVAIMCFGVVLLPSAIKIDSIPEKIFINDNESELIDVKLPIKVQISSDDIETLKFNGNSLKDVSYYNLNKPISIESINDDYKQIDLEIEAFGMFPIKNVSVSVDKRKKIIPGGQSIGVALFTKGVLVVGTSEINIDANISKNPAKEAGIIPGDIIVKINDEVIDDAGDISEKINNSSKGDVDLLIARDGVNKVISVSPALDQNDEKYKLGLWVRDSTAGVGTLTFIDPEKKLYGGLGHAITDIDTGKILTIQKGEILASNVIEITKAENGIPGELKGYFSGSDEKLGNIMLNTTCGIFGEIYEDINLSGFDEQIYAGHISDVALGKAYILSTIDGQGVKKYNCEIININNQSSSETKSFIIKITDVDLISKTGGIVQGMSGSPIIQGDKLIGAVTHVFVNDPTKGYGIYLDRMMDKIE